MSDSEDQSGYAFSDIENEKKRLQEQSRIIGATTRRMFEESGIAPGMKVLDLGSGAGDVVLMLADLVGPGGSVVGVDRNPDMVATAEKRAREGNYNNVTVLAGDAQNLELDDDFDALVGRAVLMYVPDPARLLKALLKHVKPGGVVAFQEVDFTLRPVALPMTGTIKQAWDWIYATIEKSGTEMQMGFKLIDVYLKAGLPEPVMHMDAFVGGASWPGLDWFVSTIKSLLPTMEKLGVATAEEVDIDTLKHRIVLDVVNNRELSVVGMSNTWICAWARKPGS